MRSMTTKVACDLRRVCMPTSARPAMLVIKVQSCLGLHAMLHTMLCTPHDPHTTCVRGHEGWMPSAASAQEPQPHLVIARVSVTRQLSCRRLPMGASGVVEATWCTHLEASVHGALAAAAGACAVPIACLLVCHAMPAGLWSARGCRLTCSPALRGTIAGFY